MAGADIVKTMGREAVDQMELQNRAGRLTQQEVRLTIEHWQGLRQSYQRADNPSAARAAGGIISDLLDLEQRADPGR